MLLFRQHTPTVDLASLSSLTSLSFRGRFGPFIFLPVIHRAELTSTTLLSVFCLSGLLLLSVSPFLSSFRLIEDFFFFLAFYFNPHFGILGIDFKFF